MDRIFLLTLLCLAGGVRCQPIFNEENRSLSFTIDKTFNGEEIPLVDIINITLVGVEDSSDLIVKIRAPFYNNPAPQGVNKGQSFAKLLDYEVVVFCFLNDNDEYLEVEVGPGGQHNVLLRNETRNTIRNSLPLDLTSNIIDQHWEAELTIRNNYFPPKVTKFNAFAINGVEPGRRHLTLFPQDSSATEHDFHDLSTFHELDLASIDPLLFQGNDDLSRVWQAATRGQILFTIDRTFNGGPVIKEERTHIVLTRVTNSSDVLVTIDAPFYDDPAPSGNGGQPFLGLWDYEVVGMFFLNNDDQYLEVEIGPNGQFMVMLFNGKRTTIRHSLPLDVNTEIVDYRWTGELVIPGDYFPPQVTKFNAYTINGEEPKRRYCVLYPEDSSVAEPDLHNLSLFQSIDIEQVNPVLFQENQEYSELWKESSEGRSQFGRRIFRYQINKQWNDFKTDIGPTKVTLQGFEEGIEMNFTIPLNDDPYPPESFNVVFENIKGESTKISLFVDGKYDVNFFVDRKNKINTEKLPLDYRMDTRSSKYITGSVYVPPVYFPANVKLTNMYSVFGFEKVIAMTLQPVDVFGTLLFRPDMDRIEHFKSIDFDLLVQSNLDYSNVWRKMLELPLLEETIDEQRRNEVTRTKYEHKQTIQKTKENKDELLTVPVAESKPNVNEEKKFVPKNQLSEDSVSKMESILESKTKTNNNEEILIPKNQQSNTQKNQEAKETTDEKLKNENLAGLAADTTSETKINKNEEELTDPSDQQITQKTESKPDVQEEKHIKEVTDEKVKNEKLTVSKTEPISETTTKTNKNNGKLTVSKDQQPTQKTESKPEIQEEQVAKEINEEKVKNEKLAVSKTEPISETKTKTNKKTEKLTVSKDQLPTQKAESKPEVQKGQEAKSNPEEKVKNEKLGVPKTEFISNPINTKKTEAKYEETNEKLNVPGTKQTLKTETEKNTYNEEQNNSKTQSTQSNEQEEKLAVPEVGKYNENEEKRNEAKENSEEKVKSDDPNFRANVSEDDDSSENPKKTEEEEDVEEAKKEARLALSRFNQPLRYLLKRRNQQVQERDEYQRRYEESNSDKNELPISFEITLKNLDKVQSSQLPDMNNEKDNGEGNIETIIGEVQEENVNQEDIFVDENNDTTVEEVEESIIDDSSIVEDQQAPNILDLLAGLFPPLHPICFTEGLIRDDFRCQVFYECVIENGKWEIYSWRCKRGFYFDEEEVACLKGYC